MQAVFFRHIFCFIFSLLLSYKIIPMLIKAAFKFNILDAPNGELKKHANPVPYLGGFAIYISFIATLAIAYPFQNTALWLLLGSTFLLFVGFVDDLKVMTPGQKFFAQCLAVLCFLKGGCSLKTNFFVSYVRTFLSGFWMLSVINAFNLIDVMDGLSAIVSITVASSFLVVALLLEQYLVSLLLVAMLGGLCGFFWYNKPPARIYLGDAGSLFLGGFFAAIPLMIEWSRQSIDIYYTPVIILAIPLLELGFLVLIRSWLSIPFYYGSPHHFSIFLQKKRWNKWKILAFTFFMSTVFSTLALMHMYKFIDFYFLACSMCIMLSMWVYTVFYEQKSLKVRMQKLRE
ncbi:MAG: undecaprenyl/decaprenyl-phosphate alpha-N-acetylglucosaminyl 1-phosphate transferase [Epsilonproteobacteria bacterium]|nr:undecaprenyl/decaprenyl-phosphate alpha-N-acetylglucosaminyl 1-phosphate transferase [Campylobacterota bacterium]